MKGSLSVDVSAATCRHHLGDWDLLLRASDINDIVTSTCGLASAFSLIGSETSHPKPELCDKQPIPLDLRSLHNGCFG